ncbi:unnamed protein product, partial [Rotaria sp. Silwood1]
FTLATSTSSTRELKNSSTSLTLNQTSSTSVISKNFRRTPLIRERHGTKFEDEILLLRGEEEKFLNSSISYKKLPNIID